MEYRYTCKECGKPAAHRRNADLQTVKDEETGKVRKTTSLGTWHCQEHGKVAVRRVKA